MLIIIANNEWLFAVVLYRDHTAKEKKIHGRERWMKRKNYIVHQIFHAPPPYIRYLPESKIHPLTWCCKMQIADKVNIRIRRVAGTSKVEVIPTVTQTVKILKYMKPHDPYRTKNHHILPSLNTYVENDTGILLFIFRRLAPARG